jgi:hypothetical protein
MAARAIGPVGAAQPVEHGRFRGREVLVASGVLGLLGVALAVVASQCIRRPELRIACIAGGSSVAATALLLGMSDVTRISRTQVMVQAPQEGGPAPDGRLQWEAERLRGALGRMSGILERAIVQHQRQETVERLQHLQRITSAGNVRIYTEDAPATDLVAHLVPLARHCAEVDVEGGGKRTIPLRRRDYADLRSCIHWEKMLLGARLEGCDVNFSGPLQEQARQLAAYAAQRPASVDVQQVNWLIRAVEQELAAEAIYPRARAALSREESVAVLLSRQEE